MSHAEDRSHRGTICLEEATVISHQRFPGEQYILRVEAPRCAVRAAPGSFAHLGCDPLIPMRRPLSIMRADPSAGWLDFLYKPIGMGLAALATRAPGDTVSLLGPIGNGFTPDPARRVVVAIAGGVGIPPVYFLADRLRGDERFEVVVFMGSEVPFPFATSSPSNALDGLPPSARLAVTELDGWGVRSALASNAGLDGCFHGHVPDLARTWLDAQTDERRASMQIVSCGPEAMLRAVAALARDAQLPCSLAVEEFMACGVGGCAGCIVRLQTPAGVAMKRVCVDGPVFDAAALYPA